MTDDIIDSLKIKIERAKASLPVETVNAIATVDWRAVILGMREKKGYTFEQLGDLETETELLLCGLVSPENYPKELENRMKISKVAVNELVNEMNNSVFSKIREELVKNTERRKIFAGREELPSDEIPPRLVEEGVGGGDSKNNHLAPKGTPPSKGGEGTSTPAGKPATLQEGNQNDLHALLAQKLSSNMQNKVVETNHSLPNLSSNNAPSPAVPKPKIPSVDPYREMPEA